jgi:hypothetical protein
MVVVMVIAMVLVKAAMVAKIKTNQMFSKSQKHMLSIVSKLTSLNNVDI